MSFRFRLTDQLRHVFGISNSFPNLRFSPFVALDSCEGDICCGDLGGTGRVVSVATLTQHCNMPEGFTTRHGVVGGYRGSHRNDAQDASEGNFLWIRAQRSGPGFARRSGHLVWGALHAKVQACKALGQGATSARRLGMMRTGHA